MLTALLVGALGAPAMFQVADTTFPVQGASRLQVENQGGTVVVEGWDRNEIRLQSDHGTRTVVTVRRRGEVIQVESEGLRGPALITDLRLWVPRTLDVRVEGMFTDVTIRDLGGDVRVETLEGSIEIVGGTGSIRANSVNGVVQARDTRGRLEIQTVARGIVVDNAGGEVFAESVSGPIVLRGMTARTVDAGNVTGRVLFQGQVQDGGRYDLGSHSGRIAVILPRGSNANVSVASLTGSVESAFPGQISDESRRSRALFTLGSGGARIDAQTFSGGIHLMEAGSEAATRELERPVPDPATDSRRPGRGSPPAPPRPPGGMGEAAPAAAPQAVPEAPSAPLSPAPPARPRVHRVMAPIR